MRDITDHITNISHDKAQRTLCSAIEPSKMWLLPFSQNRVAILWRRRSLTPILAQCSESGPWAG